MRVTLSRFWPKADSAVLIVVGVCLAVQIWIPSRSLFLVLSYAIVFAFAAAVGVDAGRDSMGRIFLSIFGLVGTIGVYCRYSGDLAI
jgi:hypothetical protein